MTAGEIDPKDDPEYLPLATAAKEAGVRLPVLQMLIQNRKITAGIARTRNGHAYLHRDQLPTWTQIEAILTDIYNERLRRTDAALAAVETEVEALRNDLTEAREHPDAELGDDLLAFARNPYDLNANHRTMAGALTKFQTVALELAETKRHLDDVRQII